MIHKKIILLILSLMSSLVIANGGVSGGGPGIELLRSQVIEGREIERGFGELHDKTPRLRDLIVLDDDVVDVTIRDLGAVDTQELEELFRGFVKRDIEGQLFIDARIPIVDYQTYDGQIHQLQQMK